MSDKNSDRKDNLNQYIRFSSVAIQMGVIITAGALGGNWLDDYFGFETPILTIILSLLAIGIALYLVIKEVNNMTKENDE